MMQNFDSWKQEAVENSFDLVEVEELPLLQSWTESQNIPNDAEIYQLSYLKNLAKSEIRTWNEDELKLLFIGPLVSLARLKTDDFKTFTQRTFSTTVNDIEIGGRVDLLIAKGKRSPKHPFFCIHEYKQEENPKGDALGQLLVAMVASQALNEKEMPILGSYIIGRNWFFVILEGKKYAVSKEYDAADEDIFQIFAILQKSKEIIQRFI